jgi:hypothetical protein
MAIYKRGDTYWYEFRSKGERVQRFKTAGAVWVRAAREVLL